MLYKYCIQCLYEYLQEHMQYEHAYEQMFEEKLILTFSIEIVMYQLLDFGFPF